MAFLAFWGLGLSVYVLDGLSVATGTVFTLNNAISEKAGAALAVGVSAGTRLDSTEGVTFLACVISIHQDTSITDYVESTNLGSSLPLSTQACA